MTEESTLKNGKKLKLWGSIIGSILAAIILATVAWVSAVRDIAKAADERRGIERELTILDHEGTHLSRKLQIDVAVLTNTMGSVKCIVDDNNKKLDELLLRAK